AAILHPLSSISIRGLTPPGSPSPFRRTPMPSHNLAVQADFPGGIFLAPGTILCGMAAQPRSQADAQAPAIDWGSALAAHEGWLRKVILARTGEIQAVDE